MTCIGRTVAVGATLILGSISAQAADLYGGRGGLKDYGYTPTMVESSPRNWYLRLDGGYMGFDRPIMVEGGIYDLVDTDIKSTWTLGGGVGTYFTSNVRGDLTVHHQFRSDVHAANITPGATLQGGRDFGLDSTVILANLYYDFTGISSRVTPYIGVGLGGVYHHTSTGTISDPCGCTGTIDSGSSWHVAGAAMAGVSVKLRGGQQAVDSGSIKDAPVYVDTGRNLFLDVGYRYLYLGETATGTVRSTAPTTAVVAKDVTVESIHGHEFRVGLRYEFR